MEKSVVEQLQGLSYYLHPKYGIGSSDLIRAYQSASPRKKQIADATIRILYEGVFETRVLENIYFERILVAFRGAAPQPDNEEEARGDAELQVRNIFGPAIKDEYLYLVNQTLPILFKDLRL